jgi:sec-independent protein translocase protein TatA
MRRVYPGGVFNIGPLELIVVLIIALLVLGPQRLPDAARSVGRGLREFRGALSMDHDEDDDYEPEPPASPQAEPVKTPEQAATAKPPDHVATVEPPTPAQ